MPELSENDHHIKFKIDYFKMQLNSHSVFSCFSSSKLCSILVNEHENTFSLTPDRPYDPHSGACSKNKDNMLDCEGSMREMKDRITIILPGI